MPISTIFRPFRHSDAERSDRTAGDRLRHRQKIRESIRENIADIIAEESIIGKSRDRVIKVPIRGIREYRFVYGDNTPGVGQGDGGSEPGQVVGLARDTESLERWLLTEVDQVTDAAEVEVHVRTRRGSAARELAMVSAEFSADALVIGAPRHFWHHIIGSVPGWLARHANCPVIVVP